MVQGKNNMFEKHPTLTLIVAMLAGSLLLYGFCSIRWINTSYTENQKKSIKTIIQQYYAGKIIDNNVGRFIKLREHRPNSEKFDRPSRNYMKNVAPNTIERKYYRFATDKDGFIEPSSIHEYPELKIVFLGGSTTECLYMDEKERFPYRVGRLLEEKWGKTVNSYNGGVSANESLHDLNILMNKVLPLHPHIVVLMENINDLVVLRSQGSYWYQDSVKSHIQTAKNVFTRYELPQHSHDTSEVEMIEEYQRNLETFIAICRIRDIIPVLMTQANRVDDDPLYHHFNEIVREVGKEYQVLVIDLANAIPPLPENLYDHYHYTAKGSQLAANMIAEKLAQIDLSQESVLVSLHSGRFS